MDLPIVIKKHKIFCKMNGRSLKDLDSRIENYKKYKLFKPDSVIDNIFNEEFKNNMNCECWEYCPDKDYFLCEKCDPQIRYNNNFNVKYLTMFKEFCKVNTLGARDFSSAVSGLCQVSEAVLGPGQHRKFAARGFGLRPTPKIPIVPEKNLWYPGYKVTDLDLKYRLLSVTDFKEFISIIYHK